MDTGFGFNGAGATCWLAEAAEGRALEPVSLRSVVSCIRSECKSCSALSWPTNIRRKRSSRSWPPSYPSFINRIASYPSPIASKRSLLANTSHHFYPISWSNQSIQSADPICKLDWQRINFYIFYWRHPMSDRSQINHRFLVKWCAVYHSKVKQNYCMILFARLTPDGFQLFHRAKHKFHDQFRKFTLMELDNWPKLYKLKIALALLQITKLAN